MGVTDTQQGSQMLNTQRSIQNIYGGAGIKSTCCVDVCLHNLQKVVSSIGKMQEAQSQLNLKTVNTDKLKKICPRCRHNLYKTLNYKLNMDIMVLCKHCLSKIKKKEPCICEKQKEKTSPTQGVQKKEFKTDLKHGKRVKPVLHKTVRKKTSSEMKIFEPIKRELPEVEFKAQSMLRLEEPEIDKDLSKTPKHVKMQTLPEMLPSFMDSQNQLASQDMLLSKSSQDILHPAPPLKPLIKTDKDIDTVKKPIPYMSEEERNTQRIKDKHRHDKEESERMRKLKEERLAEYKKFMLSLKEEFSGSELDRDMSYFFPKMSQILPLPVKEKDSDDMIMETREKLRLMVEEKAAKKLAKEEKERLKREERKRKAEERKKFAEELSEKKMKAGSGDTREDMEDKMLKDDRFKDKKYMYGKEIEDDEDQIDLKKGMERDDEKFKEGKGKDRTVSEEKGIGKGDETKDKKHLGGESKDKIGSGDETKDKKHLDDESKDKIRSGDETKDKKRLGDETKDKKHLGGESKDKIRSGDETKDKKRLDDDTKDKKHPGGETKDKKHVGGESKDKKQLGDESKDRKQFGDESKDKKQLGDQSKDKKQLGDESKDKKQLGGESKDKKQLGGESKDKKQLDEKSIDKKQAHGESKALSKVPSKQKGKDSYAKSDDGTSVQGGKGADSKPTSAKSKDDERTDKKRDVSSVRTLKTADEKDKSTASAEKKKKGSESETKGSADKKGKTPPPPPPLPDQKLKGDVSKGKEAGGAKGMDTAQLNKMQADMAKQKTERELEKGKKKETEEKAEVKEKHEKKSKKGDKKKETDKPEKEADVTTGKTTKKQIDKSKVDEKDDVLMDLAELQKLQAERKQKREAAEREKRLKEMEAKRLAALAAANKAKAPVKEKLKVKLPVIIVDSDSNFGSLEREVFITGKQSTDVIIGARVVHRPIQGLLRKVEFHDILLGEGPLITKPTVKTVEKPVEKVPDKLLGKEQAKLDATALALFIKLQAEARKQRDIDAAAKKKLEAEEKLLREKAAKRIKEIEKPEIKIPEIPLKAYVSDVGMHKGLPIKTTRTRKIIIGEKIKDISEAMRYTSPKRDEGILVRTIDVESLETVPPRIEPPKEEPPSSGVTQYTLSDRKYIAKGWTVLPTEKIVRKLNIYRMQPAHPEFDWFEHNKNKRIMEYDTGEKLAEFDSKGRGRWFYKNGRIALDYYDSEDTGAGQRFVVYSSGEPDDRGRSCPYTVLATFDHEGNGVVFDHSGKIRLKYNQTEGVLLDRDIGPVSHWKWHTLNDPPILQQVMIDTKLPYKDQAILKMGRSRHDTMDDVYLRDKEEMLAIEMNNVIQDQNKSLNRKFKPFQIKMKALKVNEHFALRILNQAAVYLNFREGTTNLKLNLGMKLDSQVIVDTDIADLGDVTTDFDLFPARTDSIAELQRFVEHAQQNDKRRTVREQRIRIDLPCCSADKLIAAKSRPLRLPLKSVPPEYCECCECRINFIEP